MVIIFHMKNSLKEKYPELLQIWDYDHNPQSPQEVSFGSNLIVNWKCPNCSYSYPRTIFNQVKIFKNRKLNNICPICRGKRIIPGYNSLKAKYPSLVESEWDYDKNEVLPEHIAPHANKNVWWLCKYGHSYQSSPNNKLNDSGNCPYCSHQKVSIETSLQAQYPEIAKEWHPTKNVLGADQVLPYSSREAWWKCSICGHEFKKIIYHRLQSPFGCKQCNKGRQTSVSEQIIYKFLLEYFPDAKNSYKINKNTDLDIYLPSVNIGIEYDGVRYHKNKCYKDIEKSKRILSHGIRLIRIRENGCPPFILEDCKLITVDCNFKGLKEILPTLLNNIAEITANKYYFKEFDFNNHLRDLKAEFSNLPYEKSLEYYLKEINNNITPLVAIWDTTLNGKLTPRQVSPKSTVEVYWRCPNNPDHKSWIAPVHSVVNGYGCKICSKRQRYTTQEWIEQARKVHSLKYNYTRANYIDSNSLIEIECSIHGYFSVLAGQHLSGRGCPYCAGQAFHIKDSLINKCPELIKEWDSEKNREIYGATIENTSYHDGRLFYWHCNNGKPHSFTATIWSRLKGSKCAVCHGKQVSSDTCLAFLKPELAKEWCIENDKTPEEVSLKSDYVALWKCKNPNHPPYRQRVEVRSRGTGCIFCSPRGKKHPKDFEDELKKIHPEIQLLKSYVKSNERIECKCKKCGYEWSPFPYHLIKGKGCPKCKVHLR